jgi:hypothetical protein
MKNEMIILIVPIFLQDELFLRKLRDGKVVPVLN